MGSHVGTHEIAGAVSLAPGTRLGRYEILAAIGAGGMGEVYRARDPRLGRDVAIKVLPASMSADADRLRRFEQEARAAGVLSHPNITAVLDVGSHDGAPYVVQELLEGETLRALLGGGRLAPRRAVEVALQVLSGLAAAHERGIVHRDLKPENLFVARDGRVKILDFGLARVMGTAPEGVGTDLPTETHATGPGVVLGTVGYMAPEQVKGQPADARSDLFAFGAILYEMLAGSRAFRGDSAAETFSAILREDPPDLSSTHRDVPPGLDRIVRHCLEKSPAGRFQSARDVAFDLEALSDVSAPRSGGAALPARAVRRTWARAIGAAVLLAGIALGVFAGRALGRRPGEDLHTFRQLTFGPHVVFRGRFAPDGKTIVFSGAPRGNVPELFVIRPEFPEARPLGVPSAHLLSISSKGELAILTNARWFGHDLFDGTLARMPLAGGAPREVLEHVREADFAPDGAELAIIRDVGGKDRLEYPPGKLLCESGGYLSDPRVSPRGDRIAFFEHPFRYDDRGHVAVVDLAGKKRVLSGEYGAAEGIAWSPDGREVLYSAGVTYSDLAVRAVTPGGRARRALESAGGLTVLDAAAGGRWLVKRDDNTRILKVLLPNESVERDLSWLDVAEFPRLSRDGRTLLFTEQNASSGVNYAVCVRRTDGSPAATLGEGTGRDLSPDGRWVLAALGEKPQQMVLYPTGPGATRRLDRGEVEGYESMRFFNDGQSVLACGHEPGHAPRCWIYPLDGGPRRPVTPDGTSFGVPSPDGRRVLAAEIGGGLVVYPASGGEGRPVPGTTAQDHAVSWNRDGDSVFAFRQGEIPLHVELLNVASGARSAFRTIGPADTSGVVAIGGAYGGVYVSEDGGSYAYVVRRVLSQLYSVEGAR